MNRLTGILLVNLGTPNSPQPHDVFKYLIEFLTDGRVIDKPWLQRQLLVRGLIVPLRYRQTARMYQSIWTKEGSPLKVYGYRVQNKLQDALGMQFKVELAMRYQEPSIEHGIASLMDAGVSRLLVLPLFPQYASATTGSVHQKVKEILRTYHVIPELILVNQFANHPALIDAFSAIGSKYPLETYDHVVFSFHGLPERHLLKASPKGCCLKRPDCCETLTQNNRSCYAAQCHSTAYGIAEKLRIPSERYTICFQSRLGKDPWVQPYTTDVIHQLAGQGRQRILVFCPAFVCDCLETIFEVNEEYAPEFIKAGGSALDLVHGLNDEPIWIESLKSIILDHLPSLQQKEQLHPMRECPAYVC